MKNILLLTTGGTIASTPGDNGLAPGLRSGDILGYLEGLHQSCRFSHENLMDLDSSNIQPEEWRQIAAKVYHHLAACDGIIITHGTDTMAYTAGALSFMLQNLAKPVVLTGSQLPITDPLTDAVVNLHTAVEAILHEIPGVSIAFDRKIIRGTRAVKVSTMGFDAFESVNAPCLAELYADGLRLHPGAFGAAPKEPLRLMDSISTEVFLMKLLPGTNPEIFDALGNMRYRGIVLEAFGTGGLHYIHRDLLARLDRLIQGGVSIVVCSQCLYERCDLSMYEVGRKLLQKGVIPGRDMTTEAAATKLMWALGQTEDPAKVEEMFARNYTGEVEL